MAQSIEITIRDAFKRLIKRSVFDTGRFSPLAEACIAEAGGYRGGARWLQACILSEGRDRFEWAHCAIEQARDKRTQLLVDVAVFQSCSLRLMPDYGGASLWLPDGRNTSLRPSDFPGSEPSKISGFEEMINRWQSRFERGCSHSALGGESDLFDWQSFQSKAAALALRSMEVLGQPLHVEQPCEWERSPERALQGALASPGNWLPSWRGATAIESEAGRMLSALDEDGFLGLLGQGAVQPGAPAMPWAAYCAHMGMPRALGALLARDPSLADARCMWGCSALEAALFASDAEAVGLCMRAGAALPAPKSISVVACLADSALCEGADRAKSCIAAWGSLGGPLDFTDHEAKRLAHPLAQEAFALASDLARSIMERRQIQAGLASRPASAPKASKAL